MPSVKAPAFERGINQEPGSNTEEVEVTSRHDRMVQAASILLALLIVALVAIGAVLR